MFWRRIWGTAIIAIALALGHCNTAHAAPYASYAAAARVKFQQAKYDEAIDLFRKHLRRNPRDYNSWNNLGAAYYHTGQPRKALRYLKQVERRTTEKSYNYYYQGLSYTAADQPEKAKEYFGFAGARFTDEYAARSAFEMGFIEYKAQNKPRAQYWLNLYVTRYPGGIYRGEATRMLVSLQQNRWLDDVKGTNKPDIEKALFKYNKLSLNPNPHYWYMQGGWQYLEVNGQQPGTQGKLQPRNTQQMAAVVNAGVGAGPWKEGDMAAFGGYTYRQLWYTDRDRIAQYTEDFTDIEYFPLRGDLLERRHQFYGDFRRDIANVLYFGAFFRWEFARIGSSLFPSPDDQELKKVLKISDTQLFIPWVGTAWSPTQRSLAYLYMRKELNEDSPDHSNKTYEFGLQGGDPVLSLGLSHDMSFPEASLDVNVELFRYEFIYNDFWLDYKREGLLVSLEHELIPRWYVTGLVGLYKDAYVLPRLKLQPCGAAPLVADQGAGTTGGGTGRPNVCPRDDSGTLFQAGVYWNYTQFQRISVDVQFVENKNPDQKEFEESKMTVQAAYTMAFPSVKRVQRFVDRYADSAFTKDAE